MKKIIFILSVIFLCTSTISFAGTFTEGTTIVPGDNFSPSKGVTLTVTSTPTKYSITGEHTNGTKRYKTDQDSGIIEEDK